MKFIYYIAWDVSNEKTTDTSDGAGGGTLQQDRGNNPDIDMEISSKLLDQINQYAIEEGLGIYTQTIMKNLKKVIISSDTHYQPLI